MIEKKIKQISVSIENSQNRLVDIADAFVKTGINLRALNLVDTGDFGLLRILVSNVSAARQIMMEMQMPARIDNVVAAQIDDQPGSFAKLLRYLVDADIKVLYTYAITEFTPGTAIMIFRFDDNDKAIKILEKNGVKLLDAESFGISQ